ncbi:Xanthine and CO dehydrogenases maturation factor, XdhC/CoxF family [Psychrobacter nivimaris]|uniref:Xanthine and CO dehydrogenases maturation factor, XdhC/CoxF family n=1 Tax=Psychrobacter nivimaris TaxID=281738 RepID=A0A6N7C1Y2_9GAMM|nr:XdhC/CoxI family protein [Psychrobacter nivimaris]KAF0568730.1 Xanthine and CO dehydrogenases maturation factor, XdhC/CoxF family [Psychrobacter nivimaris]
MNQVADILKLAIKVKQQGIDAVLATVVRTEGSAYRRAGAMMLICEDGRSVGMISGGCLEPHIIKRAFWLTRNGANVQVYQTGDDIQYADDGQAQASVKRTNSDIYDGSDNDLDDADFDELNFGLGCNGRVHVLFERLTTATPLLETIRNIRRTQQPITVATLIRANDYQHQDYISQNSDNLQIGMRINLDEHRSLGSVFALGKTTFSSILANTVEELAEYKLSDKNAKYVIVENGEVTTEWLVQRLQPQLRLLICGAGNDVMPLVTMAKLQDWHVTVVDSRSQYATRMRFPQADVVMSIPLDDSETLLKLSNNAAVALMSHSLSQDRARLTVLLEHSNNYKYLGQLGPRYRTERLINEISINLSNPTMLEAGIHKLHYPIGYKLGGDGPEALALGIMAQVNAVMHDQNASVSGSHNDFSNIPAVSNDTDANTVQSGV